MPFSAMRCQLVVMGPVGYFHEMLSALSRRFRDARIAELQQADQSAHLQWQDVCSCLCLSRAG
jgi:hypothetical protein